MWEEIIIAAESCPHLRANSTDLCIKLSFNCLQGGSASIVIETEPAKFESNNQSQLDFSLKSGTGALLIGETNVEGQIHALVSTNFLLLLRHIPPL